MLVSQITTNKSAITKMGLLFGFGVERVQQIAIASKDMDELKNNMCSEHIKQTGEKPLTVQQTLEII